MTSKTFSQPRTMLRIAAVALLSLGVAGCFDDDDDDDFGMTPVPAPAPAPAPTLDAGQCLNQEVAPGVTVANLVVPDVLNIDPSSPAGFPNGRLPSDPVIDVTLAVIFLELGADGQNALTLANLPLNPPENDRAFNASFPFLAGPQGNPTLSLTTGSNFGFRTDAASAYTRVDRMGMPAVSTALIPSDRKIAYNDASPADDAAGDFVPDLSGTLQALTEALADDLVAAGLTPCAD